MGSFHFTSLKLTSSKAKRSKPPPAVKNLLGGSIRIHTAKSTNTNGMYTIYIHGREVLIKIAWVRLVSHGLLACLLAYFACFACLPQLAYTILFRSGSRT
jgi:hypothetical protein